MTPERELLHCKICDAEVCGECGFHIASPKCACRPLGTDHATGRVTPERELRERLCGRITECLAKGGLFNMEVMEAGKVRDLLFDCRHTLSTAPAPTPAPPTLEQEPPWCELCGHTGWLRDADGTSAPAEPVVPSVKASDRDWNVEYAEPLDKPVVPEREPDVLLSWWEGKMKCPHKETISGLAKDCLPCLRLLLAAAPRAAGGQRIMREALECAEYAITHPITANAEFALKALREAMAAADPQVEGGGK